MTSPKSFEVPRCLSKCKMRGIATHLVELSVDAGQQREPCQKSHERDHRSRRWLAHREARAPFVLPTSDKKRRRHHQKRGKQTGQVAGSLL
jgi:hypothetical protein